MSEVVKILEESVNKDSAYRFENNSKTVEYVYIHYA